MAMVFNATFNNISVMSWQSSIQSKLLTICTWFKPTSPDFSCLIIGIIVYRMTSNEEHWVKVTNRWLKSTTLVMEVLTCKQRVHVDIQS